jgi:DNA repair ATPase RecN
MVVTTSAALSQATSHNVRMLNEKLSQEESKNPKLKDEITILKQEMSKWGKVECNMTPHKVSILEQ